MQGVDMQQQEPNQELPPLLYDDVGAYPDTPDTEAVTEDELDLPSTVEMTQSGEEELASPTSPVESPVADPTRRPLLPLTNPSDDDVPDPSLRVRRTTVEEDEEAARRALRRANAADRFPEDMVDPFDDMFFQEVRAYIIARNAGIERDAREMRFMQRRAEIDRRYNQQEYPPHPAHLMRRDYPRHPNSGDEADEDEADEGDEGWRQRAGVEPLNAPSAPEFDEEIALALREERADGPMMMMIDADRQRRATSTP